MSELPKRLELSEINKDGFAFIQDASNESYTYMDVPLDGDDDEDLLLAVAVVRRYNAHAQLVEALQELAEFAEGDDWFEMNGIAVRATVSEKARAALKLAAAEGGDDAE